MPFLMEHPHNLFPSLHVALCLILADLYARHTRGAVRVLAYAWFGLIGLSTLLTWQHHLVTLLLPLATAIAWMTVRRPGHRYGWWLFAGYAMCWIDRRALPLPANLQVHGAGEATLVLAATSVKLLGLLLLWTLLLQMLRQERAAALTQPARPTADAAA